jgi:hypothetical protein
LPPRPSALLCRPTRAFSCARRNSACKKGGGGGAHVAVSGDSGTGIETEFVGWG